MASMKVGAPAPAPPAETLPCPRCESKNTKFCYYNNYNFSQPRYYCKSCRRYWTHGGTLRNVPVGGGSRKSAKRSRTSSPSSSSSSSSTAAVSPAAVTTTVGPAYPVYSGQLSSFLALSGFGLGLGLDEGRFGFGLGGSGWMMPENGYLGGATGGGGNAGVSGGGGNGGGAGWNAESGAGGGDGGDYYSALPELAISTPGNVLN